MNKPKIFYWYCPQEQSYIFDLPANAILPNKLPVTFPGKLSFIDTASSNHIKGTNRKLELFKESINNVLACEFIQINQPAIQTSQPVQLDLFK